MLTNLNSKSLRKLLLINIVERSPARILLLSAATLYKASSEFFNIIDIIR